MLEGTLLGYEFRFEELRHGAKRISVNYSGEWHYINTDFHHTAHYQPRFLVKDKANASVYMTEEDANKAQWKAAWLLQLRNKSLSDRP